ncbi:hypothetical protein ASD02_32220 [Ensifer sp. Root1252]|nr:hypothetical protein ASD02_32220 [Ensifer sp. Root1252]KRC54250.1 hypothetical protein ASE32_22270 [Ensifer sp. Root231]KRD01584.1 hypothetical protein ASE47_21645 [Ensifer sp. Root258]
MVAYRFEDSRGGRCVARHLRTKVCVSQASGSTLFILARMANGWPAQDIDALMPWNFESSVVG